MTNRTHTVIRAAALGFGVAVLMIGLTGCQSAYYSSATQLSSGSDAAVITHYRGNRAISSSVCESKEECARSAEAWKELASMIPEEDGQQCRDHEKAFTNALGETACMEEEFRYGD